MFFLMWLLLLFLNKIKFIYLFNLIEHFHHIFFCYESNNKKQIKAVSISITISNFYLFEKVKENN
jgi:hypothetical protein